MAVNRYARYATVSILQTRLTVLQSSLGSPAICNQYTRDILSTRVSSIVENNARTELQYFWRSIKE